MASPPHSNKTGRTGTSKEAARRGMEDAEDRTAEVTIGKRRDLGVEGTNEVSFLQDFQTVAERHKMASSPVKKSLKKRVCSFSTDPDFQK
jgi:hypothetical protein